MKKIIAMPLLFFFIVASCLTTPLPVKAGDRTIVVPDNYPTIAAAIGNATEGDTIFVRQGTYEEHSLAINKTLTLIGEDLNNTIIDNTDGSPYWELGLYDFPPSNPDTIRVTADNVIITNFTITNTHKGAGQTTAITGTGNETKILGNIIENLTGYPATGISLSGNKNQVRGNIVLGAVNGISVSGSNETIIENTVESGSLSCNGQFNVIAGNNLLNGGTNGIEATGNFTVIYNNSVTGQNQGISVSGFNNLVAKNNVTDNYFVGIEINSPMDRSGSNIVCANRVLNSDYGIGIFWGQNNTIYANYISHNQVGVSVLWKNPGPSRNTYSNLIYDNNFVDNSHGAADWSRSGLNMWDNGSEGNFWTQHHGSDGNSDGLADASYSINSPYTISHADSTYTYDPTTQNPNSVVDHYPLMVPYNITSINVELPQWAITLLSADSSTEPQGLEPSGPASTELPNNHCYSSRDLFSHRRYCTSSFL